MQLVLASNNAKKLHELQTLLSSLPLSLVTQGSLGLAEVDEPHRSFVENALVKARHAAKGSGGAAIADDSGLCVQALKGLPGVDSAHIAALASREADRETHRLNQDRANNAWLLNALQGQADRSAYYVCVLVAVRDAGDPEPLVATGRWHGQVLMTPQGTGGFGYDALMQMQAQSMSVASMDPAEKNRLSHRALAASHMVALMRDVWRLGPQA